jgi:phage terminase large subunit GpA-like protein
MTSVEGAFVGRFSFVRTPFFEWLLERWHDPLVRKIVCRKSAQVGWTQSVINNVLGFIVHIEKTTAIAMFPKEGAARNFDREKFGPMIEATPELSTILPTRSRQKDVTTLFKSFPGGFVKFVGSNSIADVKSTSARRLIIEEPDDCNLNLRGQGDSIKLLEERGKTFRDLKILVGGTPSIKGVSSIDDEYDASDRSRWMVPCPHCGTYQALEWEQVRWNEDAEEPHPLFGRAQPETARYCCASCGALWDDAEKTAAVQAGRPEARAAFRGVVGLEINELYSSFFGSRLQFLVERFLTAKFEEAKGETGAQITFWNTALGRSWEFKADLPDDETLAERGLEYEPLTVPAGGLVLTMGVDCQHNRLAVVMRAWGRGEESWLVLFDEIEGNIVDLDDECWNKLDELVFGRFQHSIGTSLGVRAVSIDSGDGVTAETVYRWVRTRTARSRDAGVALMAIKGSNDAKAEIFARPKTVIDTNRRNTKAARHGLAPFMVGVSRGKDLVLGDQGGGRLKLEGEGPARFHWYRSVRADYLEQLTSEVKVPVRELQGTGAIRRLAGVGMLRRVWVLRRGRRNEALDAEMYALHAARSRKTHLMREEHWQALEAALRQAPLFDAVQEGANSGEKLPQASADQQESPAFGRPPAPKRGSSFVTGWRR